MSEFALNEAGAFADGSTPVPPLTPDRVREVMLGFQTRAVEHESKARILRTRERRLREWLRRHKPARGRT